MGEVGVTRMIHQTGEYPGMSHHEQPKLQNELSVYNYIVVLYCLYREGKQIEYFFPHLRRIHLIGANLQVEHISQVLQIRNRKHPGPLQEQLIIFIALELAIPT